MAPKHEESLVGRTFEKCRIIAKLGMGGMGSVWLAEHFGLGRKVAVKILPPAMGQDPEYVARFMREATTAGRMEHPNIVQIHDVGYAEGRHFIVMQYVDGESLSTVVENLGAMDPMDAAKIAAGMLRGLQHAHEEGVVHRDVKPDNVLIAKGDEPKLLDFGLAIETETALQITKDGMVVGTPYYLAPEQARGQKATPLCDVYAAGVTLYYLVTGKRPFVGATALAVLNKHIHEPPVPPMKHRPVIPKPLNDIILKMMAKKPAERYQSAGAAASDLELFLKGKPVDVDVPLQMQLPFGLSQLSKKQLTLAASGAGGLLLILVVLLIVAFSGGKKQTKVVDAPPTKTGPVEPDESVRFRALLELEKQNKENTVAYPEVLDAYDLFIRSTVSTDFSDRANKARKAFLAFVETRAGQELDRRLKETDPYKRVKSLQEYPKVLLDLSSIDKRLREEYLIAHAEAEKKYLDDERALEAAIRENRHKEAGGLLDALIPVAEGPRRDRLQRLKADLPRLEKDYDDETLRRLSAAYEPVHAAFVELLTKRETGGAYSKVAKFLRDQAGDAERQRTRVGGLGYEPLIKPFPETTIPDSLMQARVPIALVFARARDSLSFRILSDLQDAMDVEFMITEAVKGLRALDQNKEEIQLVTLRGSGRVSLERLGFQFNPKGAVAKIIDYRQLQVQDLLQLTALAEGQTADGLLETSEPHCRAMGAAWIYTAQPERWAQAGRCFQRAEKLGAPGLAFRIEGFRERGYQDVRERIIASRKELDRKNFDVAKQLLAPVETAWSHDPVLAADIGRAMAAILVAEVVHHERNREYPKLKQAARQLRTKYPKLYPEEVIFAPYANAMRLTGVWGPAGSLLNDDWTWENKGQGSPCPADDETKSGRGLRLKPDKPMRVTPIRSRGVTGAAVDLALAGSPAVFSTGFRVDVSDKDGTSRKIVVRDTGEVAVYAFDGRDETRLQRAPLGKKLSPGQWVELSFVAEGGDLVVYLDQRPVLLMALPMTADRDLELWTSTDANFRGLRLRR